MKYQDLKISKKIFEFTVFSYEATKNYAKEYRHNIAFKITDNCLEMMEYIYRANASQETREENLNKVLELIRNIDLLYRVSFQLRLINEKRYADYMEMIGDIRKQCYNWKR